MDRKIIGFIAASALTASAASFAAHAQRVDYSVISVDAEAGTKFERVTSDNDYVCMPEVRRRGGDIEWLTNRILGVTRDGSGLAYLSWRDDKSNIFIMDLTGKGRVSSQRTKRQGIIDFAFSPDGKSICFSEMNGDYNEIYQTSATEGYTCRLISGGSRDWSPVWSPDMGDIYFARQERNGFTVWSYNVREKVFSNYCAGMNPCPTGQGAVMLCTRLNSEGRGEIWRIDNAAGTEECLLADMERSFSSPMLSPDGQWILLVGSNVLLNGRQKYANTDIFACRADGSDLTQLTFHAADDLSPVWSADGRHIYFVSQRGSDTGTANVWRMSFDWK